MDKRFNILITGRPKSEAGRPKLGRWADGSLQRLLRDLKDGKLGRWELAAPAARFKRWEDGQMGACSARCEI